VVVLVAAVPAFAESPWWHLTSTTRPSYIQPGQSQNAVVELKVSAEKGDILLAEPIDMREYLAELSEEKPSLGNIPHAVIPYDASAGEVEQALEGIFPGRKTLVTENVGGTAQAHSFTITFVGQSVGNGEEIPPVYVSSELATLYGGEALSGAGAEAQLETVSAGGRPDGMLLVRATNLGDASTDVAVQPVTLKDTLPPGLEAVAIEGVVGDDGISRIESEDQLECSLKSLSCVFAGHPASFLPPLETHDFRPVVAPYEQIEMRVSVKVMEGAQGATTGALNEAEVTGGGAPAVLTRQSLTVSDAPIPFGVSQYEMRAEEAGGALDTQAGSHPFQMTSTFSLNRTELPNRPTGVTGNGIWIGESKLVALAKDLHFKLPPGLVGNPTPFPECPMARFLAGYSDGECPAQTAVGVVRIEGLVRGLGRVPFPFSSPVYVLEPKFGEPARFGFVIEGTRVILDTAVRSGGDYGVTVSSLNTTQAIEFLGAELTLWGVPGDPRHSHERGVECLENDFGLPATCPAASEEGSPPPLLELPTSCTGPLQTSLEVNSWQEQGVFSSLAATQPLPALDGCDRVPFDPSIGIAPDGREASTPTGLTVSVHVPQAVSLTPTGLGEGNVRNTTVALPEGMQISPAAADGLLSCSLSQAGFTGVESATGMDTFDVGPTGCASGSKIGTAEVKTPLLSEPLIGGVYLAAQSANPFGSLIAMYLDVENAKEGVAAKIAGEVRLDERTGQIVATFPNAPQLPYEEAKLHFFGGERAPLSTPPLCGSYTGSASVTPWSSSVPVSASSTFTITSGPNGSPCANPRPFQPGFEAGTTSVQAGGYTPMTMTMSRPDADQPLGKLDVVFPPGVSAGLQGVKLCEEPQAASGDCPAESEIGQVIASAGLAGDPYSVEGGKAYITGPYAGAPFGVDVVVPAVAGPFNLGTEVVRSKVEVDPTDAHLTVVSDEFPTMLDGIPLQLQHINVTVNRPGFVFNPTNCEPMKLAGQLESSEGATADVSTPFQVTNCAALSFRPEFKVSTEAKTSRVEGATLRVKLTIPAGAEGTKANVKEVKVSLPKQLPSPLKTLQKACTEKVFAENPANCPNASKVGEAKVSTPVLEGGLSGPAYFVSHGGAKYPELIMVLTGENGVTVDVHGETLISKQGITTATFSTVPDVPFSTFELTLPKREYPALSANGNLCQAQAAGKLLMPTEMIGQNGVKLDQSTKISVTGCPKGKHVKRGKRRHHVRSKPHGRRGRKGNAGSPRGR
jgi:hypothetical protein